MKVSWGDRPKSEGSKSIRDSSSYGPSCTSYSVNGQSVRAGLTIFIEADFIYFNKNDINQPGWLTSFYTLY